MPGASITITDMPTPLLMTKGEQEEIIQALKKDTHRFQGDDSFTAGPSYSVPFNICLFRGPDVLIIGLDDFGLGLGDRDEFRFINPSFVRAVDKVLRKNGVYTPETADYYRNMLAKGAVDPGPDAGLVTTDGPIRVSDMAPRVIASFVGDTREGEISARINRTHGTEIGLDRRGADSEALLNSLVEDSWPTQSDEKSASAPMQEDAIEITVGIDLITVIAWLDESGFRFGKDGKYRFDNPSLAREIEKLFEKEGMFDSPGSAAGQAIANAHAGKGNKYKQMLEAAAGKKRPEGAARQAAVAAREQAKQEAAARERAMAKDQSLPPPQEPPAEIPVIMLDASEAIGTIVTPHMEVPIDPNTNVMWCSTFQLAWNEMCTLAGGPLQIVNAPPMVGVLNKRTATRADLDEASYLAMAGVGPATIEKINKELARKFPGTPLARVPADIARNVGEGYWIAYSCLLKDLLFDEPFERSSLPMRFVDANVVTFGVTPYEGDDVPSPDDAAEAKKAGPNSQLQHRAKLNAQVLIHDFKDSNDFIVELLTKSKDDRLILAKVKPGSTLSETIDMVLKRVGSSKPANMANEDSLKVPIINVDISKRYEQLIGKTLVQARMPILEALQVIRFRLDEKGAQLMSLAFMSVGSACPHWMEFDKPYLVLLQRKDAKHPYFAMWVANPGLMAKMQVQSLPRESPAEKAKALGFQLLEDPARRLKGIDLEVAADDLADTGKPGVPYLIKGLQSHDAIVRTLSARGLAKIGPGAKDATEILAKAMIAEKDGNTASEIAGAIGKVGPPPAKLVPAVLAALKERGNLKEVNYRDAMVALGPPAVPALITAMESPDRDVQHGAIESLGRIGPGAKSAVDALVRKMLDANSDFVVLGEVYEAIGQTGTPAIPALFDAVKRGKTPVQERAAHALGGMGTPAVTHLMAALKKRNPYVRSVAADALGNIEPPAHDAVDALIGLIKDPSDDVRFRAYESLAMIGDAKALGVMLIAAKDDDEWMRSTAAMALGAIRPVNAEAINALIALLHDKESLVRRGAIMALGEIGPKAQRALPELDRISKNDDEPDTREMARDACTRITSPETKPSKSQSGIFAPQ